MTVHGKAFVVAASFNSECLYSKIFEGENFHVENDRLQESVRGSSFF